MITVGNFLDAIEQNGLTKIKHYYIDMDMEGTTPIGGCAVGQASLNLNVDPETLNVAYYEWLKTKYYELEDDWSIPLPSEEADIVHLNDYTDMSLKEIAGQVRSVLINHLDVVLIP